MTSANQNFSSSTFISKSIEIFRFGNWWHYKIPPLIAIFFFSEQISREDTTERIWAKLLLLICWMFVAASFGYFVNDWSDIEEDSLAGKKNFVANHSLAVRWLVASCLFFTVIIVQFFLNGAYSFPLCLSILQLLFFVAYSVPPIRLKRYLFSAIFCDSLYAHVLPAAIIFTSICRVENYLALLLVLCVWQFTGGVRNILLHHLFDGKNDARSGNSNLANRFHPVAILNIINRFMLPLDLFLVIVFFCFVSIYLVYLFIALVLFRLFLVTVTWRVKRLWRHKKMSYWLLNDVYEGYIPFISILLFSLSSFKIFIALCFLYPFMFPQFISNLANDRRHLFNYLKSIS